MGISPQDRAELRDRVVQAFKDAPYPGDDNLIRNPLAVQMDDYAQIVAHCKGKHWQELDRQAIVNNDVNLPFFSPEAFRFYLPAFLVVALEDPEGNEFDKIVFNLLPPPPNDSEDVEYFAKMVAGLSRTQREVIRDFLELVAEEEADLPPDIANARQALDTYWGHS